MKNLPTVRINSKLTLSFLVLTSITGCSVQRDERLVSFAEASMAEQVKQNAAMAEQSRAIVHESKQLAETANQLVEQDALARRELFETQRALTAQNNQRQAAIDANSERLDRERRAIASQRNRDPIVAEAIKHFGLLTACLLPLIVAVAVVKHFDAADPSEPLVSELLIKQLTDGPLERVPLLGESNAGQPRAISDQSNEEVEAPF